MISLPNTRLGYCYSYTSLYTGARYEDCIWYTNLLFSDENAMRQGLFLDDII